MKYFLQSENACSVLCAKLHKGYPLSRGNLNLLLTEVYVPISLQFELIQFDTLRYDDMIQYTLLSPWGNLSGTPSAKHVWWIKADGGLSRWVNHNAKSGIAVRTSKVRGTLGWNVKILYFSRDTNAFPLSRSLHQDMNKNNETQVFKSISHHPTSRD